MNEVPIVNLLPEKWRGPVLIGIAISPYVTRAAHALYCGHGIWGAVKGIFLGTNQPKPNSLK